VGCLVLLLLIAWPIAEIKVLILASQRIGGPTVLLLLAAAALLGSFLMRRPGLGVAASMRRSWAQGVPPARGMFDALCLLAAGFLLLLPGFLSDGAAVLLLLPPVRALLFRWATNRLVARVRVVGATGFDPRAAGGPGPRPGPRPGSHPGDVVIDAEWEEVAPGGRDANGARELPAPADDDAPDPGERRPG
jgi:UPF0716 protein FxsA